MSEKCDQEIIDLHFELLSKRFENSFSALSITASFLIFLILPLGSALVAFVVFLMFSRAVDAVFVGIKLIFQSISAASVKSFTVLAIYQAIEHQNPKLSQGEKIDEAIRQFNSVRIDNNLTAVAVFHKDSFGWSLGYVIPVISALLGYGLRFLV